MGWFEACGGGEWGHNNKWRWLRSIGGGDSQSVWVVGFSVGVGGGSCSMSTLSRKMMAVMGFQAVVCEGCSGGGKVKVVIASGCDSGDGFMQ
ncbi:hypothetical protein E3N88_00595 [Mikania micrantha]|uniref:Uncharacterized protein n=1 Tax=Mikania micrantha TaxID=192012 RepID=A0A5N6PYK4_9ASTR|nr:hypothetical protein E3N88_00595 [Mikania micrantha]